MGYLKFLEYLIVFKMILGAGVTKYMVPTCLLCRDGSRSGRRIPDLTEDGVKLGSLPRYSSGDGEGIPVPFSTSINPRPCELIFLSQSRSLSPSHFPSQTLSQSHSHSLALRLSLSVLFLSLALLLSFHSRGIGPSHGLFSPTGNPRPHPGLILGGDEGKFPHQGRGWGPPLAPPRPIANPSLLEYTHIYSRFKMLIYVEMLKLRRCVVCKYRESFEKSYNNK